MKKLLFVLLLCFLFINIGEAQTADTANIISYHFDYGFGKVNGWYMGMHNWGGFGFFGNWGGYTVPTLVMDEYDVDFYPIYHSTYELSVYDYPSTKQLGGSTYGISYTPFKIKYVDIHFLLGYSSYTEWDIWMYTSHEYVGYLYTTQTFDYVKTEHTESGIAYGLTFNLRNGVMNTSRGLDFTVCGGILCEPLVGVRAMIGIAILYKQP
jgi:hypothetical protein